MAEQPTPLNESKMRLNATIAELNKELGAGTIMSMDDMPNADVPVIPTGSLALDAALGVGGIPCGRVTEIFGPEGVGKSTLAMSIMAEAQKQGGGQVLYIDVENAMDLAYAKALGCDTNNMLITQPSCGEDALNILVKLAKTGGLKLVVVDSVAALTPRAELDGELEDQGMALQARMMSKAMRFVANIANKTGTAVVFINQLRAKIGGFSPNGNPETTTGGKALPYWASVRIDMRRRELEKGEAGAITGAATRIKVVKNKVAPPFREAMVTIEYGKGFARAADAFEAGLACDAIEKSGNTYAFGDTRLAVGRDNAIAALENNEHLLSDLRASISGTIRASRGLPASEPGMPVDTGEEAGAADHA